MVFGHLQHAPSDTCASFCSPRPQRQLTSSGQSSQFQERPKDSNEEPLRPFFSHDSRGCQPTGQVVAHCPPQLEPLPPRPSPTRRVYSSAAPASCPSGRAWVSVGRRHTKLHMTMHTAPGHQEGQRTSSEAGDLRGRHAGDFELCRHCRIKRLKHMNDLESRCPQIRMTPCTPTAISAGLNAFQNLCASDLDELGQHQQALLTS